MAHDISFWAPWQIDNSHYVARGEQTTPYTVWWLVLVKWSGIVSVFSVNFDSYHAHLLRKVVNGLVDCLKADLCSRL